MILYFSGTGNSRYVAEKLAALLGDRVVKMDVASGVPPESTDDLRVVWVFPVHAWSVPPVVARYIMSLPEGLFRADALHYMVATCGDDVGRTDMVWRALMCARGWTDAGAYSVIMPNTYVLLPGFDVDSPDEEARKIRESAGRFEILADRIKSGEVDTDVVPGALPTIKTKMLGPLFRRFLMSPKPFGADDNLCNGCGRCAAECPLNNIKMENGRPKWGDRCAVCLGCYHGCRRNAVFYGRATRNKGHYRGV